MPFCAKPLQGCALAGLETLVRRPHVNRLTVWEYRFLRPPYSDSALSW